MKTRLCYTEQVGSNGVTSHLHAGGVSFKSWRDIDYCDLGLSLFPYAPDSSAIKLLSTRPSRFLPLLFQFNIFRKIRRHIVHASDSIVQ
jgi:hypothetical protein